MIKFYEIGNFSNAKTYPDIKAHVDMPNYRVVAVDHINKVTAWPTAATPSHNLCVIMQNLGTHVGDTFEERDLKAEQHVLCVGLEALATRFLQIDLEHVTGGVAAVGAILVPDATNDGMFAVAAATPSSGIYLHVTEATTLTGPAVVAQIIKA